MYWTFGFIVALIIFIIIMGLLFFEAGRDVLEEIFLDTCLGDFLEEFRMFEKGDETMATGMFSLLGASALLFTFATLLFFISWLIWPLLVIIGIYIGVFTKVHKGKIKRKK